MSLLKVQGQPATRKQSYDNIRPRWRKKTWKRKTPREPEVGVGGPAAHAQTTLRKVGNRTQKMAELGEADEAELQRLVAAEQQKAQFTAQVRGRGLVWRERRMKYKSRALAELWRLAARGSRPPLRACCAWFCSLKKRVTSAAGDLQCPGALWAQRRGKRGRRAKQKGSGDASARKPSLVASSLGWHWEDPASHTAVPYRPRAPEHNTHPPLGLSFTVACSLTGCR